MPDALAALALPVARYAITIELDAPLELPPFSGTMVRSALGAAMRGIVCLTGAPTCDGCRFLGECHWPAFMQPRPPAELPVAQRFSEVPVPYVIEADPQGILSTRPANRVNVLEFCLVLVGSWLGRLPLIIASLERAAVRGFGRSRVSGVLARVDWLQTAGGLECRKTVWSRTEPEVKAHEPELRIPELPALSGAVLHFLTPLRLQKQGSPLQAERVTPRGFAAALVRRLNLLFACHAGIPRLLPEYAALCRHAEGLGVRSDMEWQASERYSARQKREIPLGGLVGELELEGDPGPLAPVLWLGQWLHVGKAASMGFGQYRMRLRAS